MTQNKNAYSKLTAYLEQSVSIAPLVSFRVAFGLLMLFSTLRYIALGWVDTQLIDPILHFSYFGFDWVKPLPGLGMYVVFWAMAVACVAIVLGWYYRFFAVLFFLCFTYVELIDITYYLNHYYFVSIVSFLMILVPSNRYFSLDAKRIPAIRQKKVERWCILIFKVQIAIVYVYAGLAKINTDWLLEALPLAIWLPAKSSIPLIGDFFKYEFTAYLFSWFGMLFDTFIILGLLIKKTRWLAYIAVVIFHTLTGILFQIGVFPIVMIFAVTIFFSDSFHERMINGLSKLFGQNQDDLQIPKTEPAKRKQKFLLPFLMVFFMFQLLFPWRYLLYPGNLFWTEEGYRFSWRVMLMEKAGTATFYVKDGETGREGSVVNHEFLNSHQEKQMAMQPDLILQYAHLLRDHYEEQGMKDPKVRAEVWVTLNARPAQLLIDPNVDLTSKKDGWAHKDWINPFEDKKLR
ncbi:HTTM domain-containing protein [Cryomorphaceae bacterium 1068]|nr:HTTM domain-containing protein [Cryomorphaceae bacterium 1068]